MQNRKKSLKTGYKLCIKKGLVENVEKGYNYPQLKETVNRDVLRN